MITLTFKVTEDEARAIRNGARRERVSVSAYLRRRAALTISLPVKPRVVHDKATGAKIFHPSAPLPPLTVESTKEMLADFP